MPTALENGVHRRINRVTREVMRQLGYGSTSAASAAPARKPRKPRKPKEALANPQFTRGQGRKYDYPASEDQIAAAVAAAVSEWQQAKPKGQKGQKGEAQWGRKSAAERAALYAAHPVSSRVAASKEVSAMRQSIKHAVAKAFGLKSKRLGNRAAHYLLGGKEGGKKVELYLLPQKTGPFAGKKGRRRNVAAIGEYNAARVLLRSQLAHYGGPGMDWTDPIGTGVSTWKSAGPYKVSGSMLATRRGGGVHVPETPKAKKARMAKFKAGGDAWRKFQKANKGMSPAEQSAKWHAEKEMLQGRNNPFVGDLALENPGFGGVTQYLTGYAVPVAVAGGAAGAIHAFASSQGWTEMLAENVGKIPVAGEFIADNLPYTLQGLLVGSGLAAVAPMVGGMAGKYLALTGGAILVFGGGIDAFNFMTGGGGGSEEDLDESDAEGGEAGVSGLAFGDLALENISALGDLALENVSALGDLSFSAPSMSAPSPLAGDELAGVYGQASYGDAYYSGADFSGEEGQALLNGGRHWRARFGTPTVRMAGRVACGPSHFAGKEGHRWGWLIRTVGVEKARQICALPPAKRLVLIHKLRQAAIATYAQLVAEAQATSIETLSATTPELAPAAGTVAVGANGAMGATNYLGDPALFMGA